MPKTLPDKVTQRKPDRSSPPGRLKIMKAMRDLLAEKEFSAITWADIARTAAVNEGLIYKYFKDMRNLLNEVLNEYLEPYVSQIQEEIRGGGKAINKLKKFIGLHFDIFNSDRVFAKILLLEVRNHPGYFQSDTYKLVQRYTTILLELIKEGMDQGDIRRDISPRALRQVLLGSIEHCCLPGIIFNKKCFPQEMTRQVYTILFEGIKKDDRVRKKNSS